MRVLIVDDNQAIRRLLRRTIEKRTTFTIVGEACNGADAVDATEQLHPDVVILDINMPVMDGMEAARLIKRAFPAVQIIVCTSHDSDRVSGLLDAGVIIGHVYKAATDDLVHQLKGAWFETIADEDSVEGGRATSTTIEAVLPGFPRTASVGFDPSREKLSARPPIDAPEESIARNRRPRIPRERRSR